MNSAPSNLNRIRRPQSERGIALILTLSMLVLVTLLVIAFAVSMRVEQTASRNFNDVIKARQLAQGAVDQAVATLREATPPIKNAPLTTYVTSPGAIFTYSSGAWSTTPTYTPDVIASNWGTVDMNSGNFITGATVEDPTNSPSGSSTNTPLIVGWTNLTQTFGGQPRLVGRFAYWVDDESTKVNLNTAGTRGNDPAGAAPDAIELQELFSPEDQVNITNFVATVRPFDTVESVEQVTNLPPYYTVPNANTAIDRNKVFTNKFYLTVNSTSPDLTPWGTKRLNLTALATNTSLSAQQMVTTIANQLSDPGMNSWFGDTLADKYANINQVAANILDYMLNTNVVPTDSSSNPMDTTAPSYLGLGQTPYLNELVISNSISVVAGATTGSWNLTVRTFGTAELWYMYTNAPWTAPSKGQTEVALYNLGSVTATPPAPGTPTTITFPIPASIPVNANSTITAASYGTFSTAIGRQIVTITGNQATITMNAGNPGTITAIFRNQTLGRYDYASIFLHPLTTIFINDLQGLANAGGTTNLIVASGCYDPRVKPVSYMWLQEGLPNTPAISLGTMNGTGSGRGAGFNLYTQPTPTNTASNVPYTLVADGDPSCHIASSTNLRGTMSLGEMAFIHVGPWRTFFLQPQPTTAPPAGELGLIPDWAVVDLFSTTDATNVPGRMNINALIQNENVAAGLSAFPERLVPFYALLTNNWSGNVGYSQSNATDNIYNYQYANSPPSQMFSPRPFKLNASEVYCMAGQVCEAKGVYVNAGQKAPSETATRGIVGIITPRSDVFTVWAIAQSIIDVNKNGVYDPGTDIITGESKVQAIVQRYEDPPGTVKFRTLYYRYLTQ